MDAYNHGIRSAASANWIIQSAMVNYFWSGSSMSDATIPGYGWYVNLTYGYVTSNEKYVTNRVVCVR